MTDVTSTADEPKVAGSTPMSPAQARDLAKQYGLRPMGVRPPLFEYIRQIGRRRTFIQVMATSRAYALNQNTYLGQLWSILNPVLNAIVYVVIFGLLMGTRRGLDNFIAFIVVGTFIFRFFQQSASVGAKSIGSNIGLVRSMQFPRAVLPISNVLSELTTMIPGLVAMCVIVLASGFIPGMAPVPITWRWFLLIPAVLLMWIFNTGFAFMWARWVAITPDLQNIIPFTMRFIMYGSGVMFSISQYVTDKTAQTLLNDQPFAVYLELARSAVLSEKSIPLESSTWLLGIGWAVAFFLAGFLMFWRAEERYGRV